MVTTSAMTTSHIQLPKILLFDYDVTVRQIIGLAILSWAVWFCKCHGSFKMIRYLLQETHTVHSFMQITNEVFSSLGHTAKHLSCRNLLAIICCDEIACTNATGQGPNVYRIVFEIVFLTNSLESVWYDSTWGFIDIASPCNSTDCGNDSYIADNKTFK